MAELEDPPWDDYEDDTLVEDDEADAWNDDDEEEEDPRSTVAAIPRVSGPLLCRSA